MSDYKQPTTYKRRDEIEAELEELKNRSCKGCEYEPTEAKPNFPYTCGTCSRFYSDGYEKKGEVK